MTKGTYGGFTYGSPWGLGFGLYVDSYGKIYPQGYGGTPRLGLSAGYSPNLEGLLTGTSVSGSAGNGSVRFNAGTSGGASGYGFGTPGIGVTYGLGPYEMSHDFSRPWRTPYIRDSVAAAGVPDRYNVWEYNYPGSSTNTSAASDATNTYTFQRIADFLTKYGLVTPAMGPQDELSPFERSLQSKSGSIGPKTGSAVPFLGPREQNPLGAGMGDGGASVTHPSVVGADTQAPADSFDNPRSPVLRALQKYRRSAAPEGPSPPASARTASLRATLSSPIAPDGPSPGFDVSGLPSWMRNALAYQPQDSSSNTAPSDEDTNSAPDDPRNVRRLAGRLATY